MTLPNSFFLKIPKYQLSKIGPVGAEMFFAEDVLTNGQTDMRKLIAPFRNFANAPKKKHGLGKCKRMLHIQPKRE
jgi:hypothetical protein